MGDKVQEQMIDRKPGIDVFFYQPMHAIAQQ